MIDSRELVRIHLCKKIYLCIKNCQENCKYMRYGYVIILTYELLRMELNLFKRNEYLTEYF